MNTLTRTGIVRPDGSDGNDVVRDLNSITNWMESNTTMYLEGTQAAKPSATKHGRLYHVVGDGTADENGLHYYENGAAWINTAANQRSPLVKPSSNSAVGWTLKAQSGQTGDLMQWYDGTPTLLHKMISTGELGLNTSPLDQLGLGSTSLGALSVMSRQANAPAILIKNRSDNSGNQPIFGMLDSAGSSFMRWGRAYLNIGGAALTLSKLDNSAGPGLLTVAPDDGASAPANKGLQFYPFSTFTGDYIQQLTSNGGTVMARLKSGGIFTATDYKMESIMSGASIGRGELAYIETTSDEGSAAGGSALTDIPGLSQSFTVASTRKVRITARALIASTVSGDRGGVVLDIGGSTVEEAGGIHLFSSAVGYPGIIQYRATFAAGTYTVKLRRQRQAGTGNIWSQSSSTKRGYILIEDIGG